MRAGIGDLLGADAYKRCPRTRTSRGNRHRHLQLPRSLRSARPQPKFSSRASSSLTASGRVPSGTWGLSWPTIGTRPRLHCKRQSRRRGCHLLFVAAQRASCSGARVTRIIRLRRETISRDAQIFGGSVLPPVGAHRDMTRWPLARPRPTYPVRVGPKWRGRPPVRARPRPPPGLCNDEQLPLTAGVCPGKIA
jgi:hypothetical protein